MNSTSLSEQKGIRMRIRTRRLALTEGVFAGVFFGTAAIFIRFLQDLDSFSIAFWRLIVASIALLILSLILRRSLNLNILRKHLKELVLLGFFLGLHLVFFVSSVKDTTILNATVLVNTTPIFSMLVSSFMFRLKPSRQALVGLTISFVGICIVAIAEVTSARGSQLAGNQTSLKGDLEALMAAVVEAFYLNFGKRVRNQASLISIMLPTYLLTAIVVGALSLPVMGKIAVVPLNVESTLALISLGLFPTAIAHSLYFSSLSNLKSFETATMALLEPIGATILGMILFQEMLGLLFAAGAGLILFGVLFVVGRKD